jgi:hypothetical protein
MVSSEKFNAPKLVNGSENRCSFIFDKKYDELEPSRPDSLRFCELPDYDSKHVRQFGDPNSRTRQATIEE